MRLFLAPLAGFTDAPFRRLCHEGGADLVYTEMVSAAALAHGHSPTHHLLETMAGEGPVACQLFGAREDELALAVREVSALGRFAEINLNAGCPMPKVTRTGSGAKLAEDPERLYRLVRAMTAATTLPVTVKTRLGPHPGRVTVFELIDAAERAGAAGFILHARFTSQMHGGALDLERLAEVVARARIPVVGNGSVTGKGALAAMAQTGVSAVMIGRAALTEPAVFARLKGEESSLPERAALVRRHLEYILEFRDQLAARYPLDHVPSPDGIASLKARTQLARYFAGVPGAAKLRLRLNSVHTLAEVQSLLVG